MSGIPVSAICNDEAEKYTPDLKDWGFSFMAESELSALRIAYAYRNNPNGVLIEHGPNGYLVTVWNELATKLGFTSRGQRHD